MPGCAGICIAFIVKRSLRLAFSTEYLDKEVFGERFRRRLLVAKFFGGSVGQLALYKNLTIQGKAPKAQRGGWKGETKHSKPAYSITNRKAMIPWTIGLLMGHN